MIQPPPFMTMLPATPPEIVVVTGKHHHFRRCSMSIYPGGKNGSGVYQKLINLIPPHDVYIEPFLGSGAIMRNKRPARHNIGLDLEQNALNLCKYHLAKKGGDWSGSFLLLDAFQFLREYEYTGNEFIYCDPPYHPDTRGTRKLYNYEMDAARHVELLQLLLTLPCKVMLSGYDHPLYHETLPSWTVDSFTAQTRRGPATEFVWYNYPIPNRLHDYSYLGKDYRERERIKNKKARWINKLENMDRLEKLAIISAIDAL